MKNFQKLPCSLIYNILVITFPIIISVIVFLLPDSIQNLLVLRINDLNLWSWFTHIFVHNNISHLLGNILAYLAALVFSCFALKEKQRKDLYKIVLLSFVLVPAGIFILTIVFMESGLFPETLTNHVGFSGVSASALGFLVFIIAKRIQVLWNQEGNRVLLFKLCSFIFIPALGLIVINSSFRFAMFIFVIWIIPITNLILTLKKERKPLIKNQQNKKEFIYLIIGMIILFFGITLLFPEEIVKEDSVTNIFSHLIGFILGSVLIFIYYIRKERS